MFKRVLLIGVLALAGVGIGGAAAEADDNGDPDCIASGIFVGGVTDANATCQWNQSDGDHVHCPVFIGPALVAVAYGCA